MRKKIISCLLAAALAVSMAGCVQDGNETENETQPSTTQAAQEVLPGSDSDLNLQKGQTLTLSAELPAGQAVTWTSSDPDRASVDENGTVTALFDRGSVTVTAAAGGQEQTWEIVLCQPTPYGEVSLNTSDEKLTIGVWAGSYHWFDEEHMQMMQDAGINLIIGISDKWICPDGDTEMLDLASQYGISVLADLRDWDGETVPSYAEHPALLGFLMYDEPSSTQFEHLAELKETFEQVMPEDTMFFVNLFPEACSYESLFGNNYQSGRVDYEEFYLKNFVNTVDPACISYDGYALQEGGLIRTSYYHNFDVASHLSQEQDIPFWYTLLSSGHSTTDGRYVTPTDKELRWQMALGMCYGSSTLSHFLLCSRDTEDYVAMLEYVSYEPTEIYYDVMQADQEFLAWQDIYMSYDWVGTAKVDGDGRNEMFMYLEYDLPMSQAGVLTGVESDEDLLVGVFEKDGENAYMLVNAGDVSWSEHWMRLNFEMQGTQAVLQLADGDYLCAAVINQGQITYVPVSENNTVSVTVGEYDSVFVIPITA